LEFLAFRFKETFLEPKTVFSLRRKEHLSSRFSQIAIRRKISMHHSTKEEIEADIISELFDQADTDKKKTKVGV